MKIHVLPGDAQVEDFRATGLDGEIVVCREALVDGDVRANGLEEFWQTRERFLTEAYPESPSNYRDSVVSEFEKLLDLPGSAEVNLWFEYELFCHVNMWFCVWLLCDSKGEIYRIAPVMQQKDRTWNGFAGLTPDQMKDCFDARVVFTDEDKKLGVDLWNAYQNRDYAKLRELSAVQSPCFPYLKEACEAEIEKATLPKQVLRDLQHEGIEDFGEMFAGFRERAGVYGFGDDQVRRLLTEI